ncbi:hypothetical protein NKJ71_16590 [Mesorhizobium sp. M0050]|uniref:hypothetical protein n=1 Tax=Mesorhizobium sp. M0050 TaxID=2956861 RepID=UPI00333A9B73
MAFATAFQPNAFQATAFQVASIPPDIVHQPGGGYYRRRPTIYLDRDGKPVDIRAKKIDLAEQEILPELTPAMLEALMAQMQVQQPPQVDPMASIMAKMAQLTIQRELAAMLDNDALTALLLA